MEAYLYDKPENQPVRRRFCRNTDIARLPVEKNGLPMGRKQKQAGIC